MSPWQLPRCRSPRALNGASTLAPVQRLAPCTSPLMPCALGRPHAGFDVWPDGRARSGERRNGAFALGCRHARSTRWRFWVRTGAARRVGSVARHARVHAQTVLLNAAHNVGHRLEALAAQELRRLRVRATHQDSGCARHIRTAANHNVLAVGMVAIRLYAGRGRHWSLFKAWQQRPRAKVLRCRTKARSSLSATTTTAAACDWNGGSLRWHMLVPGDLWCKEELSPACRQAAHPLRAPAVVAEHKGVAAWVEELLDARRPLLKSAATAGACDCSARLGRLRVMGTLLCIVLINQAKSISNYCYPGSPLTTCFIRQKVNREGRCKQEARSLARQHQVEAQQ